MAYWGQTKVEQNDAARWAGLTVLLTYLTTIAQGCNEISISCIGILAILASNRYEKHWQILKNFL